MSDIDAASRDAILKQLLREFGAAGVVIVVERDDGTMSLSAGYVEGTCARLQQIEAALERGLSAANGGAPSESTETRSRIGERQ